MALRQRWETRSVRNNKKVRRDEKVGREGRLRQELQLHTAKQKSLNKLYSAPSPACYVISLRRLMADREIPVSSIILAGHASAKCSRLSRVFSQRISSRWRFFQNAKTWTSLWKLPLSRLISLSRESKHVFAQQKYLRGKL